MNIFASTVMLLSYLFMITEPIGTTPSQDQGCTPDNAFRGRRRYISPTTHHLLSIGHQEVISVMDYQVS
jgi:hypothetical protein